jgi:hypothetical protein
MYLAYRLSPAYAIVTFLKEQRKLELNIDVVKYTGLLINLLVQLNSTIQHTGI